jgi:hypothetical protein
MITPMALVVDVPSNTALADLDEALRRLLRRELDRHGFDGVDIAFDAPSSEWSAKLTAPTVDLFLYDLRETPGQAEASPRDMRINGAAMTVPPPLRLEVTYAVTAWSNAVEDEHRLLSQTLAILFSHASLPADLLEGRLESAARLRAIETEVGRPKSEKAQFWTSIGGSFKASIDYAVRLEVASGAVFTRGPEVRTQTVRMDLRRANGERRPEELVRFGGTVRDGEGDPVRDAWVVLEDAGRWTTSDGEGRFLFDRVRAGEHRVAARTTAGEEAEVTATVPGPAIDLEIGGAPSRRRSKGR